MKKKNIFQDCPVYKTEQFLFRKVEESDAEDLLECYSDQKSAKIFNSDNCTSDFVYKSLEEMQECIQFWLREYDDGGYIRFSIVDQKRDKAIGTIEMFSMQKSIKEFGVLGVLRLDLASRYESLESIEEILTMIDENFFDDFEVDGIITKAVPEAERRVAALKKAGYQSIEGDVIVPYKDYYLNSRLS